ncbi:MAG: vWA domain-containing protein [Planctomycetota bacterium]|jgi:Ca-activated chloride channel family protein
MRHSLMAALLVIGVAVAVFFTVHFLSNNATVADGERSSLVLQATPEATTPETTAKQPHPAQTVEKNGEDVTAAEAEEEEPQAEEEVVETAFDSVTWNTTIGLGGGAGGKWGGRRGGRRRLGRSGRLEAALGMLRAHRDEGAAGETYGTIVENAFRAAKDHPLSTFGVDVDVASYSNVRRFLTGKQLPPKAAVRVAEMINYFAYDYPQPKGKHPFSITTEVGPCPWNTPHQLVLIGLQAKHLDADKTPPKNLVFLLDVSGSMDEPMKLPLVKQAMKKLVTGLGDRDTVAIVTYAGQSRIALTPTSCRDKTPILDCLNGLAAAGSTNGEGGIQKAYELAQNRFHREHMNRVILVTDGDFNVGISERDQLVELIEKQRDSGVFLTVVGVGTGNLRDDRMSSLAKHGNGQYLYLDSGSETRKHFETGLAGTLVTVAKDVKVQVLFNPRRVASYRLIGYERRVMRAADFRNDAKDSGEIGAGHAVTALYQVVPVDQAGAAAVTAAEASHGSNGDELLQVRLRYEAPWAEKGREVSQPLLPATATATDNLDFAGAVAAFGMLLSGSKHCGNASYTLVSELARSGRGKDPDGHRAEFQKLARTAQELHEQVAAGDHDR